VVLGAVRVSIRGPARSAAPAPAAEASATVLGRFVIRNIYGWGGIPGGRLRGGIYVTLYHPRSGTSRELVTDGKGYVAWEEAAPGIYVLREITYVAESLSDSSRLSAPLTPMSCVVAPSSATYCGTVVYTFRRLPEGQEAYVGRVWPEKPGVQGLDILDETEETKRIVTAHSRTGEGVGPALRTSLWTGPKGLPTWEAAVHFHQGREYAKRRRYEDAIPEFRAGLENDPQHAWAHYMLARAHQWHGRDEEAIAEYGEAFGLQPDFAWAHHSLGLLYLLKAEYALARAEFQRAAAADPGFVPAARYHLKKLERLAHVAGTPLEAYRARTPEEASLLAEAQAAIDASRKMDWDTVFASFADDARIEAHCGLCDPSKFFSVEELSDYLSQPIAKNYRLHRLHVRLLEVAITGGEARVKVFASYELAKTNEEKGWWFADISTLKAKKVDGRWRLTEHRYDEHLH
ncbi:MAG: tetratricopeptide repeat protein, partial [Candidatus Tectimicrobiota bacterium]